jgi:hypothetical protein
MLRVIVLFFTLLFPRLQEQNNNEQPIFARIEFVYKLKQTVAKDVWKTFNDTEYDVPLIYFTDTSSYIANPTQKFLSTFKSEPVYESQRLKVYKTERRVDNIPFHMETGMTLGTPTDEYNYHSPFMNCSSYEVVHKTIPDVLSTEEWTTMIMHEYFHGYQHRHQPHLDYYEQHIVTIGQPDSLLKAFYKNNDWYKNSIDLENGYLLKAIDESDKKVRERFIDTFFSLREERRALTKQKLSIDIEPYEKCYETMEGTARYVEYSLYNLFSTMQADKKLANSDTSFKSFSKYRNYSIEKDKWLYLTSKTTYFYASGFNMARLLDKLAVEYKSKLFKQGSLSLEELLRTRGKTAGNNGFVQ